MKKTLKEYIAAILSEQVLRSSITHKMMVHV
jgi:hypothetical protein